MEGDVVNKQGFFFPVGALASPVLGGITSNLAGPLIRRIIGGRRQTRQY